MKKIIIITTFLVGFAIRAQAQTYKPFKLDFDFGGDITSDNAVNVAFGVEPHYRFTDLFSLGFRIQAAIDLSLKNNGSGVNTYSSGCITGDFYLTKPESKVAIFAGGGLGDYTQVDTKNNQTDNFGYFPRAGVEVGRFRGSLEYNFTGGVKDYLTISAGFFIGGKKK